MSDTINRMAAIDAVEFGITYAKAIDVNTGESKELFKEGNDALRKAVERLKELPSAESELPTCCDYDINQLITFAIACRKAGIEEKDLKKFVTDMTSIYEMIMKDIEKIMSGVIRNE